jgi:hypothetical protein
MAAATASKPMIHSMRLPRVRALRGDDMTSGVASGLLA